MLRRISNARLLHPGDVRPSRPDMEVIGVFNPGAVRTEGGDVVLLLRVAERPVEQRPGFTGLPRYEAGRGVVIDWTANEDLDPIDPRVVRLRRTGAIRLTYVSTLAVARSPDGRTIGSLDSARMEPESRTEEFGLEDPRIVRLDSTYWITYVCVSRHGAATALASTEDFRSFVRHGVIFPPENKDVVLFSRRFEGRYVAIHRPNPATGFGLPEMWLATSPDLVHWGRHAPLHGGSRSWEGARVGAGAPPFLTPAGWIVLYHGSRRSRRSNVVGTYVGAAMRLDAENPSRILATSDGPVLAPETEFELDGVVPNVVFPTAAVETGEHVLVYYGAADTSTAVVEFSISELLASLAD